MLLALSSCTDGEPPRALEQPAVAPPAVAPALAPPASGPPTAAIVVAAPLAVPAAPLVAGFLSPSAIAVPARALSQRALDGGAPEPVPKRKKLAVRSEQNLYFCTCGAEWPRPKGTQGNPHHQRECARRQRADGVITADPVPGVTRLRMLPAAAAAGRADVIFQGPGPEDWVSASVGPGGAGTSCAPLCARK